MLQMYRIKYRKDNNFEEKEELLFRQQKRQALACLCNKIHTSLLLLGLEFFLKILKGPASRNVEGLPCVGSQILALALV